MILGKITTFVTLDKILVFASSSLEKFSLIDSLKVLYFPQYHLNLRTSDVKDLRSKSYLIRRCFMLASIFIDAPITPRFSLIDSQQPCFLLSSLAFARATVLPSSHKLCITFEVFDLSKEGRLHFLKLLTMICDESFERFKSGFMSSFKSNSIP